MCWTVNDMDNGICSSILKCMPSFCVYPKEKEMDPVFLLPLGVEQSVDQLETFKNIFDQS